ncbi:MAG: response regulator [Caulobacterales bacterium]|nr:response regulator [Caulobacterales bacterium]
MGDASITTDSNETHEPLGSGEVVLMVEDNPEVCVMGEAILSDLGYAVVTAASADEALEMIEGGLGFDLLFTDIVMPGTLNGVQLAQEARRRDPTVGVLLTTGWLDKASDGASGREAFDLIGKPYRRSDLARKLRAALNMGARAA